MPDHLYRHQVTLQRSTQLPEDVISNTWHFDKDEASAGDWLSGAQESANRLVAFYTAIAPFLGNTISGVHTVKTYDMRDGVPRVPRTTLPFTLAGMGAPLPAEVAVCLSFKATAESGVNMARRRGRVFLGPLNATLAGNAAVAGDVRPSPSVRDAIVAAGLDLVLGGAGDARLAIYSPTTDAASSIDDSFFDVEDLWVDDAFDTVRSRGARATTRTTANVVG